MSRRDRAALRLAYECLRMPGSGIPMYALDALPPDIRDAWECARHARDHVPWFVLRARLALLLRVLLRADAGDLGPTTSVRTVRRCRKPRTHGPCAYQGACWSRDCGCWERTRAPVHPLWESARPHGGKP